MFPLFNRWRQFRRAITAFNNPAEQPEPIEARGVELPNPVVQNAPNNGGNTMCRNEKRK